MIMKNKAAALLLVAFFVFVKLSTAQQNTDLADTSKVSSLLLLSENASNADSAFTFAEEAFAEAQRSGDARSIAAALIRRGELKGMRKDPYGSLRDLTEALKLGDSLQDKPIMAGSYRQLADLYASVYNFPTAYNYQRLHYETRDSILEEEEAARIGQVQSKIDSVNAEKEKAIAEKDGAIINLEQDLARSKWWTLLLGVAAVLALSLIGFLFYRRGSAKAEVEPTPAPPAPQPLISKPVSEKQEDGSYALRLHHSLLPRAEHLAAHFPDHFVFYKQGSSPGSDLHWAHSPAQNEILIAAARGSGEGDAAFTSVLVGTMLSSIVKDRKIHHPNLALNVLRDNITPLLNVNGQRSVDVILCRINLEKMVMSFSSTDSLLWIVRDQGMQTFDTEAMPIGPQREVVKAFPMKNIELQKGDIIYISTCEKHKAGELQALLHSVKDKPMQEQQAAITALSTPFDLTVIGIRI